MLCTYYMYTYMYMYVCMYIYIYIYIYIYRPGNDARAHTTSRLPYFEGCYN